MSVWRQLPRLEGSAAAMMAMDEALFLSDSEQPWVRCYTWAGFCLSLGRFQSVASLTASARTLDSDRLVRRITGGRAVLHGDDLTIAMGGPISALGLSAGPPIRILYQQVIRPITGALRASGLAAAQACGRPGQGKHSHSADCFTSAGIADTIDEQDGRKLVGGSLHRNAERFLFQASIPSGDPRKQECIRHYCQEWFGASSCLADAPALDLINLESEFYRCFAHSIGSLEVSAIQPIVCELSARLERDRYRRSSWTLGQVDPRERPIDTGRPV